MRPSRCHPTARALRYCLLNVLPASSLRLRRTLPRPRRVRRPAQRAKNVVSTEFLLAPGGLLPGRHFSEPRAILPFSTRRDEAFLGFRIEHVQLVVRDRELDLVADLDLAVARDKSHDLVALDLRVQQLLVAEVLDDVHVRGEAHRTVARAVGDLQVLRPEADLELLAVPLLRDLRPRAAQVQELL